MAHAYNLPVYPNHLSPDSSLIHPQSWGLVEKQAFQFTWVWILKQLPHSYQGLQHTPLAQTFLTLPRPLWALYRYAASLTGSDDITLWDTHLILPVLTILWGPYPITLEGFMVPAIAQWPAYVKYWLALHHSSEENFVCDYLEQFPVTPFVPITHLLTHKAFTTSPSRHTPSLSPETPWVPPANIILSTAAQRDYKHAPSTVQGIARKRLTELAHNIDTLHYKRIQRSQNLYEIRLINGWRLTFARKRTLYFIDRLCTHNTIIRTT